MLATALLIGSGSNESKQVDIRGVYGHPQLFWDKGYHLDQLNVNAVFLHHKSITDSFMVRARSEKLKVYAEFATLNGEHYVEKHPEAWPIDKNGNKVEKATWFMGVCPTDSGFVKYRLEELKQLVTRYDVDGVWLDYLHLHAQFEDPETILPETCFNSSCIKAFEKATGVRVPAGTTAKRASYILKTHQKAWRRWRTRVIASWVKQCRTVLNENKPGTLLGIYHCPWNDTEYDSARIRILGLDYDLLKGEADIFSPMVYHERMGRDPGWVKENIRWFTGRIQNSSARTWPIVQAYNDPEEVDAEEFESVLRHAIEGGGTGVMMFTSGAVAEDSIKIQVMKRLYGEWRLGERGTSRNNYWVINRR